MNYDELFIKECFKLAKKGEGKVSPNPLVGVIIVKNDRIISKDYYTYDEVTHAEIKALRKINKKVDNCKLYINLEPCTHYGRTPPCVDEIIKAKLIREVIISNLDPNPNVNGKSIKILNAAGIKTKIGILQDEGKKLNEVYFKYMTKSLPFITLKIAQTLDGKIATKTSQSKWITDMEARKYTHYLRSINDAVLVGINTVIKDDPELTVRLVKKKRNDKPIRIVLDTKARLPINARLVKSINETPLLLATTKLANYKKLKKLEKLGVKIVITNIKNNRIDLIDLLNKLATMNITSILVEGGSRIFTSFMEKKLVDKLIFFIAPKLIGGKSALTAFEGEGIEKINECIELKEMEYRKIGNDLMIICSPE